MAIKTETKKQLETRLASLERKFKVLESRGAGWHKAKVRTANFIDQVKAELADLSGKSTSKPTLEPDKSK